jgi:hypothetical protein
VTTHHETATRLAYDRRNSLTHVQLAEALRDLTAEVRELVEVVHKMAVLLAAEHNQEPESA